MTPWPTREPPAPDANLDIAIARDFVARLRRSGADMTRLPCERTRIEILEDYSGLPLPGSKHEMKFDWYRGESVRRICMDLVAVEADDAAEAGK